MSDSFGKYEDVHIFVSTPKKFFTQKFFTMNKGQLIAKIAGDAKITKTEAGRSLDSFISACMTTLKKGDKVTLVGFGTFSVSKRSARKGRNPQTGKPLNIPARKVVKFKAGKEFSSRVK